MKEFFVLFCNLDLFLSFFFSSEFRKSWDLVWILRICEIFFAKNFSCFRFFFLPGMRYIKVFKSFTSYYFSLSQSKRKSKKGDLLKKCALPPLRFPVTNPSRQGYFWNVLQWSIFFPGILIAFLGFGVNQTPSWRPKKSACGESLNQYVSEPLWFCPFSVQRCAGSSKPLLRPAPCCLHWLLSPAKSCILRRCAMCM